MLIAMSCQVTRKHEFSVFHGTKCSGSDWYIPLCNPVGEATECLSVTSLNTCSTFLQGFIVQKTTTLAVGNVLNSLCCSPSKAGSQLLMLSSMENALIKIMIRQ
jgi:hypothetical protein